MARLNKKLAAIVAIVLVVGVAVPAALLVLRRSRKPDVGPLMAKAAERATAGDIEDAITRYRRVLKLDPRCAAAHLALGELEERQGHLPAAIQHYRRAARLDPQNQTAQTHLCSLCERVGFFKPIGPAADCLLKLVPQSAEAHYWKALALSGEKEYDNAIKQAKESTRLDPGPVKAFVLLADLYHTQERYALGESVLKGALKAHPDNVDLLVALGHLYETRKDEAHSVEKAQEAFEKAVKVDPAAPVPRLRLANLFARQKKLDEVGKQLALAAEHNPKNRAALGAYGDFLTRRGRFDQARKHLEGALELIEEWPEGRMLLIDVLLNLGEADEAKKHLDKLPQLERLSMEGRSRKKYLEGRVLLAQGKPREAAARLREVIARRPRFAPAHFCLGLAHADVGELDSARACFEEATRRDPSSVSAQRQLAISSLAVGHHDAAIDAAKNVLSANPGDPRMRRLLARAFAANGDPGAAAKELDALAKQAKDPASIAFDLAALRFSQRRYQEAERLIESLPAEARSSTRARLAQAQICRATDQLERAEKELTEACKGSPHAAAPRAFLASIYRQRGEKERAQALLEQFAKAEAKSIPAQLALARFYRQVGRLPEALSVCRKAEKLDPANIGVASQLIEILLASKQPEEALAAARKIAEARPERLAARLAVPGVLVAEQKWAEAVSILEKVVEEHPNEAQPSYLLGKAYLGQKELRNAIEQLRKVARLRPDMLEVSYRLADAYFRNGDYLEAISWSERVLARRPQMRAARLISALSHARREDYARAIEEYLAAEPIEPQPGYYLHLASLYQRDRQHDRAEKALLEAQKLEPNAPAVAFALVRHYDILGKTAEAEAIIKRLRGQEPKSAFPLILLGRHCRSVGRLAEAEQAYRRAIRLDEKAASPHAMLGDLLLAAGRPSEACDAYRQALTLGLSSAPAKIAESLTRSGRLAEAKKEIQAGLEADPSDALLHIERARVLLAEATHGTPGNKLEACRATCEKAIELSPTATEAYLILAESHLAERPSPEHPPGRDARKLAALEALQRAVLTSRGPSPACIRLARLQLDLGRLAEAERECRDILALTPSDASALETLGAVLTRRNPEQPPLAVAQALAKEFPANPARHLLLGRALAVEKKWPEAMAALRACLRESPSSTPALASLVDVLVNAGKPDDAIAECQEFLERNPRNPAALDLLGEAYLRKEEPDQAAKAFERAARLAPAELRFVAAAARAHTAAKQPERAVASCRGYIANWPRDPRAHMLLGSVLAAQQKIPEAEKEFAKTLELDPDNLDALWPLTTAYVEQQRYDEAIAACKTYQKAHPRNARARYLLGRVYMAQGNLDAARRSLLGAVYLDPKLAPARFDLGNLYLRQKQYDRAIEQFEQIIAARPKDVMALNNLAWCLAEGGKDLDRAKTLAAKAIEIDPDSPSSLDTFGWICCKRKELEQATKALIRSLELRPGSPTSRYHLATALAAQGKDAEAKAELQRALAAKTPFREADAARALLTKLAEKTLRGPK